MISYNCIHFYLFIICITHFEVRSHLFELVNEQVLANLRRISDKESGNLQPFGTPGASGSTVRARALLFMAPFTSKGSELSLPGRWCGSLKCKWHRIKQVRLANPLRLLITKPRPARIQGVPSTPTKSSNVSCLSFFSFCDSSHTPNKTKKEKVSLKDGASQRIFLLPSCQGLGHGVLVELRKHNGLFARATSSWIATGMRLNSCTSVKWFFSHRHKGNGFFSMLIYAANHGLYSDSSTQPPVPKIPVLQTSTNVCRPGPFPGKSGVSLGILAQEMWWKLKIKPQSLGLSFHALQVS